MADFIGGVTLRGKKYSYRDDLMLMQGLKFSSQSPFAYWGGPRHRLNAIKLYSLPVDKSMEINI
jgi:hypothetical protein